MSGTFLRVTWAVAKRELLAYFLSPISYLIAALFLVVHSYSFFLLCQVLSTQKAPIGAVTQYFFGGTFLYWLFLMFVVAVLTMRLLAEERQRGTLEPLLTAPVGEGGVATGKYLAALLFYLFLWAPTLSYTALLRAYAGAGTLDPGPVLSGYLGTLLCGMSALSVGLLCSSLTSSQVLSAVLCFTVLSLLLLAGMLTDLYVRGETLRQVLLYTNLFRHMDEMGRGIVDSRRLVYHLSLAAAALLLAGRVLTIRPGDAGGGARAALEALLCLLLLCGVNVISARHYHRWDLTRSRRFTLSPRAGDLLGELSREGKHVQVTYFQSDSGAQNGDLADDTRELLLRSERAGSGALSVAVLDIDRDRDRVRLLGERYHIDKEDLRQGVLVVESEGRRKIIQQGDLGDYDQQTDPADVNAPPRLIAYRGEEALCGAILTVASGRTPIVCFTKGHGEAEYDSFTGGGMTDLSEALRRDNYATEGLDQLSSDPGVPERCDVVVIAGPERPFLEGEVAALSRYLDRGGRLLGLLGPMLDRGLSRFLDSCLQGLLRDRGIRLGQAVVIEPERRLGDTLAFTVEEGYGDHPVSAPLMHQRTLWTMARPVQALPTVTLPGGQLWSAKDLVLTSEQAFGETDLSALRDGTPAFTEGKDDKGPVAIAAAASVKEGGKEREGRIVVLGSSQLATNEAMALYNKDLVLSSLAWLADQQKVVVIGPKRTEQFRLILEEDQLTRLFLVTLVGMPLMALLLGVGIFWIRRG